MGTNVPETMLAFRFKPSITDPVEEHIPPPNIGPDEVLLQVLAGGVCHSDLAVLDPNNPINHRFTLMASTFTMGHEGSGMLRFVTQRSTSLLSLRFHRYYCSIGLGSP